MKIVHICLSGPYTDNWGYQENILPRMQVHLGHEVYVIANTDSFNNQANGQIIQMPAEEYTLADGVHVIRLKKRILCPLPKLRNIFYVYDVYNKLTKLQPDILFVHGLNVGFTNYQIRKFIRQNKRCKLYGDTHLFGEIALIPNTWKRKIFFYGIFLHCMRVLRPYYDKIFAITPDCIDFARDYYELRDVPIELLPLGYDPSLCDWKHRESIRQQFREKYGLTPKDIVIIHGGKIENRRRTPQAVAAVAALKDPKVKLVIFGGIANEMKLKMEKLLNQFSGTVLYLGKLSPKQYYEAYLSSDLGLFPGGQSVLWQEAIGCGLPLVVGKAKNIDYLNHSGNVAYVDGQSVDEITETLKDILYSSRLQNMKKIAEGTGQEFFSYERIAKLIC